MGLVLVVAVVTAVVAAVDGQSTSASSGCAVACAASLGIPIRCSGLFVSQGFGDTPWEHPHRGIDLVCPAGTPVLAVADGVVDELDGGSAPCLYPEGKRGGLGRYAALLTPTVTVLYGHLSAFTVADGSRVRAGETIGLEGSTGCATGPHLHFEVDAGTVALDPCPLLPAGYPDGHTADNRRCWGAAPP